MRLYHCHARWPKGRYLNLNVHGDWLRSSDSLNFSWRTFHARSMGVGPQCRSQFFPSLRIGQPHPDEFHTLWRWYPPKKRSPHGYETGDPPSIDFFCEVAHPSNPQIWWVLGNIPKVWNMVNVFVLCPNSSLIVSVANTHAMFNVLALHIYIIYNIYIYIIYIHTHIYIYSILYTSPCFRGTLPPTYRRPNHNTSQRALAAGNMYCNGFFSARTYTWIRNIPSGKQTKSYWKWSFIVDLPHYIKMVMFHSYVSLPEVGTVDIIQVKFQWDSNDFSVNSLWPI